LKGEVEMEPKKNSNCLPDCLKPEETAGKTGWVTTHDPACPVLAVAKKMPPLEYATLKQG